MARKLEPANWEQIVLNRTFGMNNAKNADKAGVSTASVQATLGAFDAVKDEDWAKCCNIIVTYDCGLEVFQWAAQKTGKTVPPIIAQSYEKYKEDRRLKNLAEAKAKEQPPKEATPAQNGGGARSRKSGKDPHSGTAENKRAA